MGPAGDFYVGDEHRRTRIAGALDDEDTVAADCETGGGMSGTKTQVPGVSGNGVKLTHLVDPACDRLLGHHA